MQIQITDKQPLLLVLVAYITGILLQETNVFLGYEIPVYSGIGVVSLLFLYLKKRILWRFRLLFLMVFFAMIGSISHFLNTHSPDIPEMIANKNMVFTLDKKLNSNEKYKRYLVFLFDENHRFRSVVSIPKEESNLDFKHVYHARVSVKRVVSPSNKYQFDYAKYLRRQGVYFQAYPSVPIEKVEKTSLSFSDKVKQKRLDVIESIRRSVISDEVRNFLTSIILADRTELHKDIITDFRYSGLIHILAISGTHIGIIFMMIFGFLRYFLPLKFQKSAIPISLLFVWLFALFIGGGNPVFRACVMITAYFAFQILQRTPDVLHALALAGFIILIGDTQQIFDVGFQLSFSAVLGIYWLNKPIAERLPRIDYRPVKILFNIFTITISAQLGTMPLMLYHFHEYSLISLVANLLVLPFAQGVIMFSFLMAFIIGLGGELVWLEGFYDGCILILLRVVKFFAEFDGLLFQNIPCSLAEAFAMVAGVFYLRYLILRFSTFNAIRFISVLILFITLRFGLNVYEYQKSEAVYHEYFNKKVLSIREKGSVSFYVKENLNIPNIERYIVKPYLVYTRSLDSKIIKIPTKTTKIKWNNQFYTL